MTETDASPNYDLENRTFEFARAVRTFGRQCPKSISNAEDLRQLIRSSGSVGANYIEANEALSKKDFLHRIRIARKEAKECQYWLRLLDMQENSSLAKKQDELVRESRELLLIFSAIIRKAT